MITWSPSAIIAARACPLQWFHAYGPGRLPSLDDKRQLALNKALGMVAHSALECAYACVQQEFPLDIPHDPDARMSRYLGQAIDALASRWRNLLLPEDDALQAQLIAEVGAVLESLPAPHPLAVIGIEETIHFTGRSGTPFKAILDLVLRTGRDSIHIRDWKRKSISALPKPVELLDDVQLCQQRVAVAERWPWARTVTVGLFSTISALETQPIELPLERALYRLDGHEVTAHRMETADEFAPRKGAACAACAVRPQCPAFTA